MRVICVVINLLVAWFWIRAGSPRLAVCGFAMALVVCVIGYFATPGNDGGRQ